MHGEEKKSLENGVCSDAVGCFATLSLNLNLISIPSTWPISRWFKDRKAGFPISVSHFVARLEIRQIALAGHRHELPFPPRDRRRTNVYETLFSQLVPSRPESRICKGYPAKLTEFFSLEALFQVLQDMRQRATLNSRTRCFERGHSSIDRTLLCYGPSQILQCCIAVPCSRFPAYHNTLHPRVRDQHHHTVWNREPSSNHNLFQDC